MILDGEDDIVERVREIAHGEGVPVVYDGLGRQTFAASLDCLRPFGVMVTDGNVTGQVEPYAAKILARTLSMSRTRRWRLVRRGASCSSKAPNVCSRWSAKAW